MRVVGTMAVIFAVSVGAAAQDTTSVSGGIYTEEQAKRGEAVSNKLCTSCHGPELSGGEAGPTLVGLEFLGNWNNLTVGDFFDRVHTTMPADAPGSMTPQQTSDVTAYVFKLNKFPAGKTELPTDLASLKGIKIEGAQPAK
jgi:mono/diheme cytochrome c family protein